MKRRWPRRWPRRGGARWRPQPRSRRPPASPAHSPSRLPPATGRRSCSTSLARSTRPGGPEALDHVLEAWDGTDDPDLRARAALALAWASGPGRQDPEVALAMIDTAIAGVAGRDRELELRLEAVRYMAIFLSSALMREALGEPERFAALEGRTAGEGELLLHVAVHRLLLGRSADAVGRAARARRRRSRRRRRHRARLRMAEFVLGGLFKADRLTSPAAPRRSRTPTRSAADRRPGSPRRPRGAPGSRCARATRPRRRPTPARRTGSCRSRCGSTTGGPRA